jgi:hypothetical protein
MIRRACAANIGYFVPHLEKEHLLGENGILEVLKKLTKDDQDDIREICIESLLRIAKKLQEEDTKQFLVEIL